MDLDIQDHNKVKDIHKDSGEEHGKCQELQNEKGDCSMICVPRMGPVKGPKLLFHGPKAINAEKHNMVGTKPKDKAQFNLGYKMEVKTDRFESDLNLDKTYHMAEESKVIDHSISDSVNANDLAQCNNIKVNADSQGERANIKIKQEMMHNIVDNSVSQRENNDEQNNDNEKIHNKRITVAELSKRQEWMEWDSDDEEWMEGMEKEFAEWKKNHSCDFCDGLDDITKLMDHFYEMQGYEM